MIYFRTSLTVIGRLNLLNPCHRNLEPPKMVPAVIDYNFVFIHPLVILYLFIYKCRAYIFVSKMITGLI